MKQNKKVNIIFDDFCDSKKCKYFITWEYQWEDSIQPYPCASCKLVGQSHYVLKYPGNCPFLKEIKIYENKNKQDINGHKLIDFEFTDI